MAIGSWMFTAVICLAPAMSFFAVAALLQGVQSVIDLVEKK